MSRAMIVINGADARERVSRWAQNAPTGTRVEFKAHKRSVDQNSRMWVLLTEVSRQLEWHGQKYSPTEWKDFFMHAYAGERFMPGEDGKSVPIGRSTSDLSKHEHSELTELIAAFCARHNVSIAESGEAAA
jgi:hypothetical protein